MVADITGYMGIAEAGGGLSVGRCSGHGLPRIHCRRKLDDRPEGIGRMRLRWSVFYTAIVAVLVAVAAASCSASSSDKTSASEDPNQPGTVSGSQDDWIESVCVTGSFADGEGGLPGNSGGALCRARAARGQIVNISQFDSDYKMRNGVAMMGVTDYVSGILPDGTVIAFSVLGAGSPLALEPLTQFGFTVNTVSPSR